MPSSKQPFSELAKRSGLDSGVSERVVSTTCSPGIGKEDPCSSSSPPCSCWGSSSAPWPNSPLPVTLVAAAVIGVWLLIFALRERRARHRPADPPATRTAMQLTARSTQRPAHRTRPDRAPAGGRHRRKPLGTPTRPGADARPPSRAPARRTAWPSPPSSSACSASSSMNILLGPLAIVLAASPSARHHPPRPRPPRPRPRHRRPRRPRRPGHRRTAPSSWNIGRLTRGSRRRTLPAIGSAAGGAAPARLCTPAPRPRPPPGLVESGPPWPTSTTPRPRRCFRRRSRR